MVVVDHLSQTSSHLPTMSDVTAAGVARLFRDHVWEAPSSTRRMISDRGTQFVSNFTQSLKPTSGDLSGSFHSLSPTDGWPTKRVNQEVEQFLDSS